ncbi:MAG: GSCFA domain-containing protein [Cyclobacteriaceae bacterium]|nr:GSCFA domain-containing protein [Cyclobacteriaceae bacterium]
MDEFRTKIKTPAAADQIGLNDKIFTLGSCFSDAMGSRLQAFKLPTLANPFGVIYNPHSLHKLLRYAIFNEGPHANTYLQQEDIFLNYDFHSEFSALHQLELERSIRNTIGASHYFLKEARYLIVTYGTAFAYEHANSGEVVANCHKVPAAHFTKVLLSQKKILESFAELYASLKAFNPTLRIILTVSPVRHIKDTLELNSVSKSILRIACHTLQERYTNVEYFPAYEIMVDDLRDYRFYKPDMIHPSELAEDYIWENFAARFMKPDVLDFIKQWKPIRQALQHKPFHPASSAHQHFLRETLQKLKALQSRVDVEEEINYVQSQIVNPAA